MFNVVSGLRCRRASSRPLPPSGLSSAATLPRGEGGGPPPSSFRARQILTTNGQQTLGVALPWAIAASLVRPSDKVLSISGDGGFLFSANELETAVRLK